MFVIVNEGSSGSRNIYWLKKYKKIWSEDEKKEKAAARQDGEKVQREPLKLRRVGWNDTGEGDVE